MNHKHLIALAFFCATPLIAGQPQPVQPAREQPAPEPLFSGEASLGFNSSYVSEGIDNVPDSEWAYGTFDLEAAGFTFSALYGRTTAGDYDELNLGLAYSIELGLVTLSPGYTFLNYPENGDPDGHEISLGAEFSPIEEITLGAVGYYDVADIGGGFVELCVSGDIPVIADRVCVQPYALLGIDFGYVSEENDAANNFQVGVEVPFAFTKTLSLVLSAHHSWALDNLEDEGLGDVSWGGARLVCGF